MKLAAGVLALVAAVGLGAADELWLGLLAAVAGLWVTREHSAFYRSDESGAWAEGFDLGDAGRAVLRGLLDH